MRKTAYLLLLLTLLVPFAVRGQGISPKAEASIRAVMAAQERAWNAGDLEGFMEGYWRDEGLKFVGKSGVTYGWQATLDRYKRGYPDRAAMGKLAFEILHVEGLGKGHALVVGKWMLTRDADAPNGHFSLVWRRVGGAWVIVADHSS